MKHSELQLLWMEPMDFALTAEKHDLKRGS